MSFRPAVVASCVNFDAAKRIVKLVKTQLASRNLGFEYLATPGRVILTGFTGQDFSSRRTDRNICGLPIVLVERSPGSHIETCVTIGGSILIDSVFYGLTSAHVLFETN